MTALDICIDVSHWNGAIDWPAVRASGIRIAFIKAAEGELLDSCFKPNRDGAAKAGIAVVPYLFLRPGDPKIQARVFREATGLSGGMPFMLDWEGRQTASPREAQAIGDDLASTAGRKPIGYWGLPGASPAAPTDAMLEWPRFIPRYPVIGINSFAALPNKMRSNPAHYWPGNNPDGLPHFAQYTCWGRVAGVNGLVDRSVAFFPSEADALAWLAGTTKEPSAEANQNTLPQSDPGDETREA